MKNFVQDGETVTLAAPADVASGAGFLVGSIFAVAVAAALSGAPVEGKRRGVFTLPKTAAQAWTQGAKLYWDNTAKSLTTTSSANTLVGAALVAAGSADTSGTVLLTGQLA